MKYTHNAEKKARGRGKLQIRITMKTENLQIQIVRWSYDKQYNECSVRMKYTIKYNDEAEKKDEGLRQSLDQDYYKNNGNLEKKDGVWDECRLGLNGEIQR